MVTGGLGGLGQLVAAWDVRNGATHLTLLGRSGRTADVDCALITSGACVIMARADVSSVQEAAASALASPAPLNRLLHAGGLLQDATLPNQSAGRVSTVMAPKCAGMERLDATRALAMRESVMFSSVASLLGSVVRPTTAPRTGGSMRCPHYGGPGPPYHKRAVGRVEWRRRHGSR